MRVNLEKLEFILTYQVFHINKIVSSELIKKACCVAHLE